MTRAGFFKSIFGGSVAAVAAVAVKPESIAPYTYRQFGLLSASDIRAAEARNPLSQTLAEAQTAAETLAVSIDRDMAALYKIDPKGSSLGEGGRFRKAFREAQLSL